MRNEGLLFWLLFFYWLTPLAQKKAYIKGKPLVRSCCMWFVINHNSDYLISNPPYPSPILMFYGMSLPLVTYSFLLVHFPQRDEISLAIGTLFRVLFLVVVIQLVSFGDGWHSPRAPSIEYPFQIPCERISQGTQLPIEFTHAVKIRSTVSHFLGGHLGIPGCVVCYPSSATSRPTCLANPTILRRRGRPRARNVRVGHTCGHALAFDAYDGVDISYNQVDETGLVLGPPVNETVYTDHRGILVQFSVFIMSGNATCMEWKQSDRSAFIVDLEKGVHEASTDF